jgi:uncharacterized membrane protein
MLDPYEKKRFDQIVTQLSADDPSFVTRVDHLQHRRRQHRIVWAWLLWVSMPILVIAGGWTGAFLALVAGAGGVYLVVG